MATTQNTYTGNGSTVLFSFTFPYLETTDIKVSLNGTVTTAYTLANATTIQFTTAPANGAAIRIYRQTDDSNLQSTFYPGSAIRSSGLNDNFTQNLYVTQEANNVSASAASAAAAATTTANTALANSSIAISTANATTDTANTASINASAAVTTANAASVTATSASANASAAVSTANTALSTANTAASNASTALSTANTAASNASTAVDTANSAQTAAANAVTSANSAVSTSNTANATAATAESTAIGAVATATGAVTTANTALSTANAAASAVANAILYDTVANVAAIPASPANNDAVELVNSTGIESFTPLSGKPVGFVGDPGLSVRIVYTSTGNTWNWIQYFPGDPESRYANRTGDNFTGRVVGSETDNLIPFYYLTRASFPVPGLCKGAVAFAADTGLLYYARSANWEPLLSRPSSGESPGYGLRTNGSGSFYWDVSVPTGGGNDSVFVENNSIVTTSYTISSGKNAASAGPLTLNEGVVITVPASSNWIVN